MKTLDAGAGLESLSLHYLFLLRLIALGGQLAIVAVGHVALGVAVPMATLAVLLVAMLALTWHGWRRVHGARPVSERYFLFHVLADVAAIGILLAATGGWTNPLSSLLILPITVAAAALRVRYTWTVAAAAAATYSLLGFAHRPLPAHALGAHGFDVHVWGMWLGFLLSAGLVAFLVARIGASLREHDRLLSQAREQALRAEQLVALGTLAAGTAHELGTPLATMAVLARELARENAGVPALRERLELLRDQVERCKGILARMAFDAGADRADSGRPVPVADFVTELLAEWRAARPGARVETALEGPRAGPYIVADRTLVQAIHNVLNNAADACAEPIAVRALWSEALLQIDVVDRGEGLSGPMRDRAGSPGASGKPDGLGLGLFLARSTVARLGGRLDLEPAGAAGTRAAIELPLAGLSAGPGP